MNSLQIKEISILCVRIILQSILVPVILAIIIIFNVYFQEFPGK